MGVGERSSLAVPTLTDAIAVLLIVLLVLGIRVLYRLLDRWEAEREDDDGDTLRKRTER